MKYARSYHSAVRLKNGTILITGGTGQEVPNFTVLLIFQNSNEAAWKHCEIYTGKGFEDAAPMKHGRYRHTSALLQDGSVLVTGGFDGEFAMPHVEIYDPRTNKWYDGCEMIRGVFGHDMIVLQSGVVFSVGGGGSKVPGELQVNSFLYDPSTDSWKLGPNLPQPYCIFLFCHRFSWY